MTTDVGRVAEATGLSQAEPQSAQGLDPLGFDPSRIEIYAKGCQAIIGRLEDDEPQYYAETVEELERRHDRLADEVLNIAGMVKGLVEAIAGEARSGETVQQGSTGTASTRAEGIAQ